MSPLAKTVFHHFPVYFHVQMTPVSVIKILLSRVIVVPVVVVKMCVRNTKSIRGMPPSLIFKFH